MLDISKKYVGGIFMTHSEIITNCGYADLNPMQFGYEHCSPSHSYGPAVRTHWLLHYVVSGFGKFTKDGITQKIHPGQIFVIPPYQETYYEADSEKPWHYIWIGFTTESSLPEIFSKPVISCPDAGKLFDEMLSCCNMDSGKSAFLAGCLWKLVSLLLEQTSQTSDYIDKALSCMHSEYMHRITIQDISDRLGLDRSYFYSLFTQRMGISPSQYLIHLRLTKAAELMTVYKEKPSVAAASVGYEDLFHFSKIFKKYYGMSPKKYIEQTTE